ncbi:MAG: HAMP domain-containing histidine kinase [Clostridia bacterium]|nr:HAMP domain-containing histidine kinase [Clostridia bacterium]
MKRDRGLGGLISTVSNFFVFFVIVAFVITCCLMLFVSTLQTTLGVEFTSDEISRAAKVTLTNVVIISLIFAAIDALRRKYTVARPVEKITEAAAKMIEGDFSVRIKPVTRFASDNTFNDVIDCINKMAEELSGVETLRSDFIASVSHEMKTPLAVIRNYATLLGSSDLSDDLRIEYARVITDASRRLADMITNILKLNRLENQQIYPKSEVYDLGEQLCECLLQYEDLWEKRGILIDTDIEENVAVSADSELLSLVWNNLISNAFKFTESGGTVTLSLHTEGEYAVVMVKDTGCGMSPEVGAHIFEKFYQGDTSHATEGNGLGLALVRRVVDIMQGEIGVESVLGVGTSFTVKIKRCFDEYE